MSTIDMWRAPVLAHLAAEIVACAQAWTRGPVDRQERVVPDYRLVPAAVLAGLLAAGVA